MDGRKRGKIPYGYRVIGGVAEFEPLEKEQLLRYFARYLEGDSMAEAARVAHIPLSPTSLPHLFKRKEYLGTDFYPQLITKELQDQLIEEWMKRKGEKPRRSKAPAAKGVRIYKDFRLYRARTYEDGNPVDCAAALYQRIRPKYGDVDEKASGGKK